MDRQLSLLPPAFTGVTPARARDTDDATSHEAAAQHNRSGKAALHRVAVLGVLVREAICYWVGENLFWFLCPQCGGTVEFRNEAEPGGYRILSDGILSRVFRCLHEVDGDLCGFEGPIRLVSSDQRGATARPEGEKSCGLRGP